MSDKLAPSGRHKVTLQERLIYEWSQTLHNVEVYVQLPPGIRAKSLYVDMQRKHLKFGIKPNPPYLDAELFSEVLVSESTWLVEDEELHIYLQKATQGEHWRGALKGHELDAFDSEEDQKRILLERFQLEGKKVFAASWYGLFWGSSWRVSARSKYIYGRLLEAVEHLQLTDE